MNQEVVHKKKNTKITISDIIFDFCHHKISETRVVPLTIDVFTLFSVLQSIFQNCFTLNLTT